MALRRVWLHTLGCKLNFSESSTIARAFEAEGYERVMAAADADVCVVNTCAVTEHAEKKCRNMIRRIRRSNPHAILAVTGCYAQLRPHEVAAIEGVDLVLGNNEKGDLSRYVAALSAGERRPLVSACEAEGLVRFLGAFSTGDRTRSFLKVQDGCDYCCAYCTIHWARGASRSPRIGEVVAAAREIACTGCREIVLTGVNTGDFGRPAGERFVDLLRELDTVEGIERYRISSIEPNLLTDGIIAFCAASRCFQHHFHIPLQSGSDGVLARMGRRYTAAQYAARIEAVRAAMPDAFVGVDVIVGFPGESEAEFMQTLSLIERLEPAGLHIFPFSARPGTAAASMPGQVAAAVATERAARLEAVGRRLHGAFVRRAVGKRARVLFEGPMKGGRMTGLTGNYLRVAAPWQRERIGQVTEVVLREIDENGLLVAEISSETPNFVASR